MTTTNTEATASESSLNILLPPEDYREANAAVFPSANSLEWFIRTNRDELIRGGALLYIAGRRLLDPAKFGALARDIGQRAAQRRACS